MAIPRDIPTPHLDAGQTAEFSSQGMCELRAETYPNLHVAPQPERSVDGYSLPPDIAEARQQSEPSPDEHRWEGEGGSVIQERLQKAIDGIIHSRDSKDLCKE